MLQVIGSSKGCSTEVIANIDATQKKTGLMIPQGGKRSGENPVINKLRGKETDPGVIGNLVLAKLCGIEKMSKILRFFPYFELFF